MPKVIQLVMSGTETWIGQPDSPASVVQVPWFSKHEMPIEMLKKEFMWRVWHNVLVFCWYYSKLPQIL